VIIDVQCTEEKCKKIQTDVVLRSDAPLPACPECGAPSKRLWTMSRPGSHASANHASVGFRFNYLEP
jgi:predicted nucleic acid-binding Zn ribbon protein